MKKVNNNVSVILALLAIGFGASSFAYEDPLLSETANVVNTDQIDIDGLYAQKRKAPSAADRVQKFRRELEEKHEQQMRKRVEDVRLKEEIKLARKIEKALSGQLQAMEDTITTKSSAPLAHKMVAPVIKNEKKSSLTVSAGFLNIASEINNLDANLNVKISAESMVSPRFSMGVGVRYLGLDINNNNNTGSFNNPSFNGYNNYGYNNYNTNNNYNRTIEVRQLSFSAHSKYFFTVDSKIRPFAGVMVAYNRGSYKFSDNTSTLNNNNNNYNNQNINNLNSNNISGGFIAGADIKFSNTFSASLAIGFEKALTSGISQNVANQSFDRQRLEELAIDIEKADIASVNIGLSFHF